MDKRKSGRRPVKGRTRSVKRRTAPAARKGRFARFMNSALTVLLLIVVFPVGVWRMWKRNGRWPVALKYALSVLTVCAACAAIAIVPGLGQKPRGGIELVGSDPEAEVYGPAAPANIVAAYVPQATSSTVLEQAAEEDQTLYVYAADGAACYHLGTCRYAYASSRRLTVFEAHFLGHKPCNICNPPAYTGMLGVGATPEPEAEPVETEEATGLG